MCELYRLCNIVKNATAVKSVPLMEPMSQATEPIVPRAKPRDLVAGRERGDDERLPGGVP